MGVIAVAGGGVGTGSAAVLADPVLEDVVGATGTGGLGSGAGIGFTIWAFAARRADAVKLVRVRRAAFKNC